MTPIIHLEDIRKSYFMGKQAISVLKGITLEYPKKRICRVDGSFRFGKKYIDEYSRLP